MGLRMVGLPAKYRQKCRGCVSLRTEEMAHCELVLNDTDRGSGLEENMIHVDARLSTKRLQRYQ